MKIEEFRKLKQKSKYGNVQINYNGKKYHSTLEARYAKYLDLMKKNDDPQTGLRRWYGQVKYPIEVNGEHICNYYADFLIEYKDGHKEVHDTKGYITDIYKLKKKLMKAVYNIRIREITNDDLRGF